MSNTKLNAIALYANFIVMALIGLIINPMLVRSLGSEHFGIWKSCLRILDLSSVADGRATQALKWIVAHQDKQEDKAQKQRDIGAAIAIWLIWLPFLLTAVISSIVALPWLISGIAPGDLFMVRLAAGLLGLNVIMTALLGIPDAVLAGTNQGYRSYVLTTLFLVFSNGFMVIAAWKGYGLVGLGAVTLGGQLLNGVTVYLVARRHVGWWHIARPRWEDVKRILSFSNLTLIWSLVQLFMLSSDVLLIGYLRGPIEVSRYTFTSYVSQFAMSICLMTGSAVAPRLGALVGASDKEGSAVLHSRTRKTLIFIVTVIASGILLLNRGFVTLWVGADFYLGDAMNLAMVAVLVQLVLIRFDAQVQDVGLRIGRKVLWGSIGAALSVATGAALYALTGELPMVLVGLGIGRLPLNIVFPRLVNKLVPNALYDVRCLVAMVLVLSISFAASRVWQPESWSSLIATAVVGLGMLTGLAFVAIFPKEARHSLLSGLNRKRQTK